MRRAKMRMETIKDVLLMPCVLTLRNNACATRLEWEGRFSNICLKAVDFKGLEGGKKEKVPCTDCLKMYDSRQGGEDHLISLRTYTAVPTMFLPFFAK